MSRSDTDPSLDDTKVMPLPNVGQRPDASTAHDRREPLPAGGQPPPPRRWWRRHPVLVGLGAVVLLVLVYFGVTLVQVWRASYRDDPARSGAIVVMGAAQYNGTPSPILKARLDHGLELWRDKLAPYIVVTGGREAGDRFTEATTGYDYLRARGVPDSAILKEVQGASTYESLAASAQFLKTKGVSEVVLVSDSYHNERLLAIAREVGLHAHVSPAPDGLSATTRLRYYLRESVAVSVGRIVGFRRLDHR